MNTTAKHEKLSPKVAATGITGALLTILGAATLGAIDNATPELFASLGGWAIVIYGAIVAGGSALAGYIKRDPLRQ